MAGADVGGFAGSPQPELLTRWLQIAAFQPIDRDHSAKGTNPQEPWENGTPEDVNIRRRYIEERYRLLPYLYTTAEEMSRTGLPIMRPLFLEFPGDPGASAAPVDPTIDNEFLLGPDILVANSPFPDEMDSYFVSLPQVGWYDYWTGARIEGATPHKAIDNTEAPPGVQEQRTLDTLPVFVRAGAIVPEQPLVQSTDEKPQGPLTLRVYPPTGFNKDCKGSLYLDDGTSFAYKRGEFLREGFTCRLIDKGIVVTAARPEGSYAPWWKLLQIEIYGATKPATEASSTPLDGSSKTLQISTAYDAEHHRITALIPDTGSGVELNLTY
jgi:alpha-glucosidase